MASRSTQCHQRANDTGLEKLVSTDALSSLFELCYRWVKCVLLNACYSELQANAIIQHIDYAIGMNHEIRDDSAIAFATGFYQALGYERPIEQSFKFGCNAIQLQISGNSNFRSSLSEEQRKLVVVDTVNRVVIPEHLKPVLKIKPNLTTSIDKSTPAKKLDVQSHIHKALEKEIALRQPHPELPEYLANKNTRFNINPSHALACKNRGDAYRNLEEYQRAIEDYNRAIELDPNYATAYNNRGIAYKNLEQYQRALEDYQKAAPLYQQQGNTEWYQDALNQIEKLQP